MRRVVREVDAVDEEAVGPKYALAFTEDGDQRIRRDVLEHGKRDVGIDAVVRERQSGGVGGRQILDAGQAQEIGACAAEGEELVEAAAKAVTRSVVAEKVAESLR